MCQSGNAGSAPMKESAVGNTEEAHGAVRSDKRGGKLGLDPLLFHLLLPHPPHLLLHFMAGTTASMHVRQQGRVGGDVMRRVLSASGPGIGP